MMTNKSELADATTDLILGLKFSRQGVLILGPRRQGRNLDPQLWAHLQSQSGDDAKPAPSRQRRHQTKPKRSLDGSVKSQERGRRAAF